MRRRADVVGRAVLPVPRTWAPRWWRRLLRRIARRTDGVQAARIGGADGVRPARPLAVGTTDAPTGTVVSRRAEPPGACVAVVDAAVLDRGGSRANVRP